MKSIEAAHFRVLLDQLFHSLPLSEVPDSVRPILEKLSRLTYQHGKQGVMDARAMLSKIEADCN